MDLNKILTISGKSGLFMLISQTKTGALVESLIDKKRIPAFSTDRISSLAEISMFTYEEDYPLKKVLLNIYNLENHQPVSIDFKKISAKDLFAYFEKILPNFDKERVYASDVKKVLQWYNLLLSNNIIDDQEENTPQTDTEE